MSQRGTEHTAGCRCVTKAEVKESNGQGKLEWQTEVSHPEPHRVAVFLQRFDLEFDLEWWGQYFNALLWVFSQ